VTIRTLRPKNVAGNSFGGIEAVFDVEDDGYCAGLDSVGGAQSWSIAPALHAAMTRAIRNATAPLFLFQAKNASRSRSSERDKMSVFGLSSGVGSARREACWHSTKPLKCVEPSP